MAFYKCGNHKCHKSIEVDIRGPYVYVGPGTMKDGWQILFEGEDIEGNFHEPIVFCSKECKELHLSPAKKNFPC